AKEFVFDDNDKLSLREDPKFSIARETDLLVDVNDASREELLRVPGIGLKTTEKIIKKRPFKSIPNLRQAGVIVKRASPFIELSGVRQSRLNRWLN
ncbi:MAG: helix-hairpin-helix domain-containing protein, partial [Candidatus Aenigmarchaeota archaeon]|nr:helix-hairpin-helix domain-containing protein [Candidatus Aenigmarchaeota archaeon]